MIRRLDRGLPATQRRRSAAARRILAAAPMEVGNLIAELDDLRGRRRVIVLDTTVLAYAVGADHPLRAPCLRLVRAIAEGEVIATTTIEVIQEFAHAPARRRIANGGTPGPAIHAVSAGCPSKSSTC